MTPKKTKVKDYDQFQLRLPPGMRDRIKAKAERAGMSMNEAIVWCLEKEFPAQVTLEERLYDLANLVSMLKDSKDTPAGVDYLIQEVEKTVEELGVDVDEKFSDMVLQRLEHWREQELDNWRDRNESPFDDANWPLVEEPPEGDPFPNLPDDEKRKD
ncbi:Arc family DNA-binding protein [Sinorhizobium medicae]